MDGGKKTVANYIWRIFFYIVSLLVLALGITMNTKAGLGVSPLISVSYSVSEIWHLNFGDMTFVLYTTYVVIEIVLHLIRGHKNRVIPDILQIVLSLLFTRVLNVFGAFIPDLTGAAYADSFWGSITGRILFLMVALILTGIGAAQSLNMQIVPNPGDGLVQAVAEFCNKSVGLTKNMIDAVSVLITLAISFVFAGRLIGVGIGTILAVIAVGRVVAVFNHFFKEKMAVMAGIGGDVLK